MPIVNYQQYCKVLDSAKAGNYALPAINVSSALTANAAMQGFAEAKSDGFIQLSTGAGGICLRSGSEGYGLGC